MCSSNDRSSFVIFMAKMKFVAENPIKDKFRNLWLCLQDRFQALMRRVREFFDISDETEWENFGVWDDDDDIEVGGMD
tara:strand:+ start:2091 stop:2324 length:234 start_codon:yes stop_codon:yes gene_type:complete